MEINQLGLKMDSTEKIPTNPRIKTIMVHTIGGVCFNEAANLFALDTNILYTGDKFGSYRDLL